MNAPDSVERDREAIRRTTAELLGAVNASNAEVCLALWAPDGVLMPPNHPSVHGQQAIGEYFRRLFLGRQFRYAFTSSHIHVAGDTALERVTYTVVIRSGVGAVPIEDVGKGLHVYGRQANGSWKLTCDIWNSDRSGQVQ
jgi:ketosteroid isomerase-like protein